MRLALRLLLVVALLCGWQSALVHPIEHVDEIGHLVHAGHDHEDSAPLCDVLDALSSCAAHSPVAFQAPEGSVERVRFARYAVRLPAAAPPFLSQGPPRFS